MIRTLLRRAVYGPAATRLRRFFAVGVAGTGVQMTLLWAFVGLAGLNYLLGAVVAIEITIVFNYVLNNAWTFRATQNTGRGEYFYGLLKTNVVRGTAIPIQVGILALLVEQQGVPYLPGNLVAIGISGIYRYVLDARWTWG